MVQYFDLIAILYLDRKRSSSSRLKGSSPSTLPHWPHISVTVSPSVDAKVDPDQGFVSLNEGSAIDFSPMADSDNINNPLSIINAVNNPVVSNSDTPQVLFALQLTRSGRPGLLGKTVNPRHHPAYDGCLECLKLPASGTRESDRIVSH